MRRYSGQTNEQRVAAFHASLKWIRLDCAWPMPLASVLVRMQDGRAFSGYCRPGNGAWWFSPTYEPGEPVEWAEVSQGLSF